MSRKILILILCLTALSGAAHSAARPMVGLLPLQGDPGTYTHAIPLLIYWQISRIPGVGIVDMGSMVDCMQLDELSLPRNIADSTGYSRLAGQTGVNYLVRGCIEHADGSRVRFRLIIYSAANPRFHSEQVYESALSDLTTVAIRAAKWITSQVGTPIGGDIEFDSNKIRPEALRLIDRSVRLCTGCEADQSEVNKATGLAEKARTLCPSSRMVGEWARSVFFSQRRGYPRFRRRPGTMSRPYTNRPSTGRPSVGRPYAGWRVPDFIPPRPKTSADGKLVWQLSDAWQTDLANIGARGMRNDPRMLKSYVGALITRHPRSAYMRYYGGRALAIVGEGPDMIRAYNAALGLNPNSFRLRMTLISAYIDWHKNDEALAAIKPALKQWPNRSECHQLAAKFYRGLKQYDNAAEEMKIVVELEPDGYTNHQMLAEDYMRAGKLVESVRETARSDEGFRKSMITFSLVLTGVFLLGVLGMVVLVKVVLRA